MTRILVVLCLAGAVAVAQDAVKVAGGQYKLIAENDDVRLLEANLAPGAKTVMHSHPALMGVTLAVSSIKWTMPDGKTAMSPPGAVRGTVMSVEAQTHTTENLGKTPLKVVLVEFKKPAPPAASARKASSAPSCKVVAESAFATAQLCAGAAGSTTAQHKHSATVVYVALTDVSSEITDAAGKKRNLEMKKDSAAIAAPETHSARNTGKTPYELIVIDLK